MTHYGRTVFRIRFGSHLYGTATPASDLKSVYVPTPRAILLGRAKGSIAIRREKAEGEKNRPGEVEEEAYSLQRFLGLAAEGQTVAVDLLFAPEWAHVGVPGPEWAEVVANRHRLLTRRSKAFIGYALAQAAKYGVKGDRVATARAALALLDAGIERHGRSEKVAALDAEIRAFVDARDHAGLVQVPQPSGLLVPHFEVCGRKLPYTVALRDAAGILRRVVDEYGKRALQAETNEGVDWKALSHAVRVTSQGLELLRTARVQFPSPIAAHVLDIKLGRVPYGEVGAEIDRLLAEVEAAAERSKLPDEVDREWIDGFVERVYGREVAAAMGEAGA